MWRESMNLLGVVFMSPISSILLPSPSLQFSFSFQTPSQESKNGEMERCDVVVRPYLPDFNHESTAPAAFAPCFLSLLLLLAWSLYCNLLYCPLCILTMERYDIYLNSLPKCKLHHHHFGFFWFPFCALRLHASLAPYWAASIIFIVQSLSPQPLFSFNFFPPRSSAMGQTLLSSFPSNPLCVAPAPPSLQADR